MKKNVLLEFLASLRILSTPNIIWGGNLNFTLSIHEVWGAHPIRDPLEGFFSHLIEESYLVDMKPPKLIPTWRNGRKSEENVAKHLDRFLIPKYLMDGPWLIKSWLAMGVILDHIPFMLKIDNKKKN